MTEIKNLAKVIEEKKQTLDYQEYTMLGEVSRKVDDEHVKSIMVGMATYGAEATCLVVLETSAFGETQRILADGNHRANSAKLLDLPLDIKVVKLTDDTKENVKRYIACLNNNVKRWTNLIYLQVYAAGNIREYVKFQQIMQETNLTITDLLFLYCGGGSTKAFQLGELTFIDEAKSDKKLEQVKRMLNVLPKYSFTRRGLWRLMKKVDNYKKLATEVIKFSKIGFSADEAGFKQQLDEIYENNFTE